jgi:hypothetical protein
MQDTDFMAIRQVRPMTAIKKMMPAIAILESP